MQASLWHIRQTASYWNSPSGLAQLAWEQRILNTFSEGVFGYYALSVELNDLHTLHTSTIPHILRIDAAANHKHTASSAALLRQHTQYLSPNANHSKHPAPPNNFNPTNNPSNSNSSNPSNNLAAIMDLQQWAIDSNSLDYIVLPHVLEFSLDPHAILREAERCLRPGGYIAITAFNPHSLLGLQAGHIELGYRQQWLTRRRLLDWAQLLNLHPDRGAFGQWRPMSEQTNTFERLAWLDQAGERWWPHFANVFAMRMVKRSLPDTRQVSHRTDSLLGKILRPAVGATATATATATTYPNNHTAHTVQPNTLPLPLPLSLPL